MSNLSGKRPPWSPVLRAAIGRASALALAKAGAQVLVHYSSSEKEADAVVAEIRKTGGRAEKVGADLRQADGPHILAKRVRAIGRRPARHPGRQRRPSRRRRASRTPRSRTSTTSSP